VNRTQLQRLAEDRVRDAKILLDGGQWSGAYYLVGYAVEFALKSCVLARIEQTGAFFIEKDLQKDSWTHDFEKLIKTADLTSQRGKDIQANPALGQSWADAKDWSETARYDQKTEAQARNLYETVVDPTNGVLEWIKKYW